MNKHIREERCEILKLQKQQKENIFINLVKEDEINNGTKSKLDNIESETKKNVKFENSIIDEKNNNQILLLFNELKEMKNILKKETNEKKIINEKLLELEKNNLELQKQNIKLQNKMNKIVIKNKVNTNKSINVKNSLNTTNTQNIITNNTIINNNQPIIKLVNFGSEDLA